MPTYYIGIDYVDGDLLDGALKRLLGFKRYRIKVSSLVIGGFHNVVYRIVMLTICQ